MRAVLLVSGYFAVMYAAMFTHPLVSGGMAVFLAGWMFGAGRRA